MRAALFITLAGALAFRGHTPAAGLDAALAHGQGFDGSRYAMLWNKSPFAIATPDAPAATQDYQLVGLAQFDGVSYASLVDIQTQEHFVLASDKPARNLVLVSVSRASGGGPPSAIIRRDGETFTLHGSETPTAPAGVAAAPIPPFQPGGMMASPNPSVGGAYPINFPPPVRIHRPPIMLPPRPGYSPP